MLKVGVAGLRRGRGLMQTFHQHRDAEVTAVCDPDPARRAQVASAFEIANTCADFDELVAMGLDVVVVATPAPQHAWQSIRALESGAHVMSEVPAAWSLDECEALAAAVPRSGCAS